MECILLFQFLSTASLAVAHKFLLCFYAAQIRLYAQPDCPTPNVCERKCLLLTLRRLTLHCLLVFNLKLMALNLWTVLQQRPVIELQKNKCGALCTQVFRNSTAWALWVVKISEGARHALASM